MRILVADDDKTVVQLVCSILNGAGHRPSPAYDSMQAIMFAMRDPQPDLVILDVMMPGGGGISALQKLKTSVKTAQVPVIVMSSRTDAATKDSALREGALSFISKPFTPEDLLVAVALVK